MATTSSVHIYSYVKTLCYVCYVATILFPWFFGLVTCQISRGSRLLATENKVWISQNGTFALGFTPLYSNDQLQLGIWYNQIPGERVVVWSANRDTPASKNAVLDFDNTGNLVLNDGQTTLWSSNTSRAEVDAAVMSESGNFILYNAAQQPVFQTFSHPSNTLLPGQAMNVSMELTSSKKSPTHGGYYTLKMLQQTTSLSLALSYNLPEPEAPEDSLSNISYWAGPDISNATGDVVAILDENGSFGVVYGPGSSNGAVYVHKNDRDNTGLLYNKSLTSSTHAPVLRRLVLESNGNVRLYRWDNDVNGSRQWVSEWAAVSSPCDIAGICGNGICLLDKSKTNSSCSCLPGTVSVGDNDDRCFENSTLTGKCNHRHENLTSEFKIIAVQQTNYYFSDESVIANYSDVPTLSKCGNACLDDCECVASVYGLIEEKPYCWVLKRMDFGGFQDPSSTLFVKVLANESGWSGLSKQKGGLGGDSNKSAHDKALVIPIVLSMGVLIALLCLLLYYNVHRRRLMKKAIESSLIFAGAPISLTYRDLQYCTSNFSQLLGRGGFGTVYKGSLGDGTLIAVKKLDKVLPHGEREFVTEVNTIGSMHHMNLVRLCGYCSEGSRRLLVYEYMKNGSLDKWIFAPNYSLDKVLDWPTRYNVALGTAQGIAYFHEQCRNRIIHCDIKPENILLDENFCPKVSDFGLAKLMGREHSHVVTMVRGTRGYLAPEWISNRPITVKADVYSYGMLLLEIIGGRRNLDMSFDAQDFFYPGWAFEEMVNHKAIKVVDKRLGGAVDEEELTRILKIAFWCIQDDLSVRPSMGEVVKMFDGTMEVNMPPMPPNILELIEEGLDNVYKAMKREYDHTSTFTINTNASTRATCSYSTMSPR
ncbi:G-type lectin S-receptor-like serine/threonine-protein kinase At5g24080 [Beta vulgaris subsp. vulgaris]|uniref:G-type lectin S-receptor-like serine/threonine-protein kinase At5g24080 n=1 Tax=Beta vulgaris subsp. vulgaris TaxID=3555 RepID=UPI0020371C09|nr:G-type lectin S-receptor-like serine/threonine-protein kinase At5g24080 [Beta vulgaris subsp. vulgaris]